MNRPPALQKGDKIGIVATAKKVSAAEISLAVKTFESWNLVPVLGKNLLRTDNQFAGSDKDRLDDFQAMIDNPEIKAIICARGGYGTTRIIDDLDFLPLEKNPRWVIGFSDITALLFDLYNQGIESVHGIMAGLFYKENRGESIESLRKVLFDEDIEIHTPFHPFNRPGEVSGRVIGGNLSIICNLIGTESDIDYENIILFIEDLNEYLYHIDRLMVHLKRAGKLEKINGLIVGDMSDMRDNEIPFGSNAYEIIKSHICSYAFPVGFSFPIGHEARNIAVPCGRMATLKVDNKDSTLTFIK